MAFCLPPGEQFLGYPVAGPDNDLRPGHRRYNVVWYRPAAEDTELRRLLTDDSGVTHTLSIPPPLIRQEHIAAMRAAAERLVAPQFRAIARLMDDPVTSHEAAFHEVGDDSLDGSFRDPNRLGNIPQPRVRVTCDAEKHLSVVGDEAPGLRVLLS